MIDGLQVAAVPVYADNNHWMPVLEVDQKRYGRSRDELIRLFQKEAIEVRPIWHLNHLQRPFRNFQTYKIENAYQISRFLNLPCSFGLSRKDLRRITGLLKKWQR